MSINIENLIQELYEASQTYYQEMSSSKLTDEEFDAKLEILKKYSHDDEYAHLFIKDSKGWKLLEHTVGLGSQVSETTDSIVRHSIPMLSLGKAKDVKELKRFFVKTCDHGAKSFRLQMKLDGFAVSASYVNGNLKTLATRGNGTEGEDITYLLNDSNVTIKGLPSIIDVVENFEIRGEIFFDDSQFSSVNAHRVESTSVDFNNPRNAVVGLMKKSKLGVDYPVEFTFSAYSMIKNNEPQDLQKFDGVITVDEITDEQAINVKTSSLIDFDSLYEAIVAFGVARQNFTVPTDGVVIKPENEAEMISVMGYNSHHPISQIVWKYPGETAESTVLDINVSVGKTGKLTPRAVIAPVVIGGPVIQSVTLSNYNWIHNKDIRIGSVVVVRKANDIIPEIVTVVQNPEGSEPVETPTICPICSSALEYDTKDNVYPPKTIICPNINCPSRDSFALKIAASKNYLDIDGLSEVTIDSLNDSGLVNDIADFYSLSVDDLASTVVGFTSKGNVKLLGEKRAVKIHKNIQESKNAPLYRVLISLNITGLGASNAKSLIQHFGSFDEILKANVEDITAIEGFGEILSKKIVEGFKNRSALIKKLRSNGFSFKSDVVSPSDEKKLSNLSFAISGEVPEPFENRSAWVEYVELNGGVFHSSPKASTSFMVADKNQGSSKIKKAKSLNVPFLTSEEFTRKFVS